MGFNACRVSMVSRSQQAVCRAYGDTTQTHANESQLVTECYVLQQSPCCACMLCSLEHQQSNVECALTCKTSGSGAHTAVVLTCLVALPLEVDNIVQPSVFDQERITVPKCTQYCPDCFCTCLLYEQSMQKEEAFECQAILVQPLHHIHTVCIHVV